MMKNIVYTKIEQDYKGKYFVKYKVYRSRLISSDAMRFDTKYEAQQRANWLYNNY